MEFERAEVEAVMDQRAALAGHDAVVLRPARGRAGRYVVGGLIGLAAVGAVFGPDLGELDDRGLGGAACGVLLSLYYVVRGARLLLHRRRPLYLFDREGLVSLRPPAVYGWEQVKRVRVGPSSGLVVELGDEVEAISCDPKDVAREPDELRAALKALRDRHREFAGMFAGDDPPHESAGGRRP